MMWVQAAGWVLLFGLSVVLLWATTGGPVRYDDRRPNIKPVSAQELDESDDD